ncbi:FecR family protein [Sphingobacterium yanglingense]|uniref:FecR family protein n=1 Tax=Sphingobacterium yanglingense TaxID=1437280 RepID=A0A4R6WGD3_9SPHI|nr:FecR family protein [Sphingobacterium yanglingense]TDQ79203.1 FecR family protein [Sphingobacterium yanglingense]
MQEIIYELIIKEKYGSLSVEDSAVLLSWRQESLANEQAYQSLYGTLDDYTLVDRYQSIDLDHAWAKVDQRISEQPQKSRSLYRYWVRYAAALLLFFSIGLYWYTARQERAIDTSVIGSLDDVVPGGNKALITFSNGEQILLDSTQSRLETIDGTYRYGDGREVTNSEVQFATVSTPIGSTYEVTLPDGTKAWLNASSSIHYPTRFTGQERAIETTGEVYLEVAADKKHPFIVHSANQRLQVLGTAFNIRSYSDAIVTTLVHGKVSLSGQHTHKTVSLQPGQQAILSEKQIAISEVNASDYTVWIKGVILNRDASLVDICQELERWYGVKFVFPKGFKNEERVMLSIDRKERLSTVLSSLEKAYFVRFEIKGKEVRVN